MGLTSLAGLFGLLTIPIIIILYMLRPKNKPKTIPSLYLWKQMTEEIESATKLKKLKSSILMLLQILIALLLTLILAGLFIKSDQKSNKLLILVECAYTMGATDVSTDRMTYAKEMASNYLKSYDDSQVTLVALEDVPKTIIKNERDQGVLLSAISGLKVVDGISDMSLVMDLITILREPNQDVVYFGDRVIDGVDRVATLRDDHNYSVHEITYTKYLEDDSITAMTEIMNHDKEEAILPISIYVDDVFFSAKQVTIEGKSSGKLFFEDIPYQAKSLRVQIDEADILDKDNVANTMVSQEILHKVLLVGGNNAFIEKALKLHPSVELYVADENADLKSLLEGYDLYVFENGLPELMPKDGDYLVFNPGINPYFESSGYMEKPIFNTSGHVVTNHIEETEFSTRVSSIYNIDKNQIIYDTPYGAGAFETVIEGNKAIIFGFNIQDTNLPLSLEFPILMMNVSDYLLSNQMIEEGSYYTGDSVIVNIFPSTTKAYVELPSGVLIPLDLDKKTYVFSKTFDAGLYKLVQESDYQVLEESFSVNVPRITEAKGQSLIEANENTELTSKSLALWLGIGASCFLCLEWWIYSYRRKIHEYSH